MVIPISQIEVNVITKRVVVYRAWIVSGYDNVSLASLLRLGKVIEKDVNDLDPTKRPLTNFFDWGYSVRWS